MAISNDDMNTIRSQLVLACLRHTADGLVTRDYESFSVSYALAGSRPTVSFQGTLSIDTSLSLPEEAFQITPTELEFDEWSNLTDTP